LRFWRAETGFLIGVFLGVLGAGRSQMFADPGALWHIVVGEHVLREGFFRDEPFGYREFKSWFTKDWLSEVILAAAHRFSGPDGALVVCAALLATFYTWIFHRFLRSGCHWLLAVLLTLFVVACSSHHFFVRPLVFTVVMLGWIFGRLVDVESGRFRLRALWVVVPFMALWTNLHAGVLGGVGTIAMTAACWLLAWPLRLKTPVTSIRDAGLVVAWTLACLAALLVNPFGIDLIKLSVKLMASPYLPLMIDEHRPISWTQPKASEFAILAFAAVYLAYLAALLPTTKPRPSWFVSLAWLWLALSRVRNGELFVAVASLVVIEHLPTHPWALWLAKRGDWFVPPKDAPPERLQLSFLQTAPALAVLALVLTLQANRIQIPLIGAGWVDLSTKVAPVEVLGELREYERSHPAGTPIFNDMNFGGFVIYFTPGLKVFIDDRCELYGDDGLIQYLKVNRDPSWIDRWADQYGYDLALVATDSAEKPSPFDKYLAASRDWTVAKRGEVATIYRRRPSSGTNRSR
jgi:hypothetical protein